MILKLSNDGLLLPRELFSEDVQEVDLRVESGKLVLTPHTQLSKDPIFSLADDPVTVPENDASTNLDRYLQRV